MTGVFPSTVKTAGYTMMCLHDHVQKTNNAISNCLIATGLQLQSAFVTRMSYQRHTSSFTFEQNLKPVFCRALNISLIQFLINAQPSAYWISKIYIAGHLVFNKFLAISFFGQLVLAGSFSSKNRHSGLLNFNVLSPPQTCMAVIQFLYGH